MATLSDDGKWLWNGKEWIPSPPTSEPPEKKDNRKKIIQSLVITILIALLATGFIDDLTYEIQNL